MTAPQVTKPINKPYAQIRGEDVGHHHVYRIYPKINERGRLGSCAGTIYRLNPHQWQAHSADFRRIGSFLRLCDAAESLLGLRAPEPVFAANPRVKITNQRTGETGGFLISGHPVPHYDVTKVHNA